MAPLKQWNWQQDDWPEWSYDPKTLAGFEKQFLLNSGKLLGSWQHLEVADKTQVKIDFLSDEAVKTSAIEGEFLDRPSVQSSIRQYLGLAVLQLSVNDIW